MVQALKAKMKEQKGFTLIELLAVIVILGIIAAIAIPAIGNVINKSDKKAEAQTGLQIINAAKLYVANNNVDATSPVTLDYDKLSEYLDHVNVKDDNGDAYTDYSVVVEKVATTTSGKYKYTLNDYPATGTNKDESTLIEEAK
ncbi:type II secretion system protein [Neobacillus drentensis]|uniref:type II secretion system protein n=1 Tax=Neobacillus drentensis TaxID=220684 RepID=UPI003000AEA5